MLIVETHLAAEDRGDGRLREIVGRRAQAAGCENYLAAAHGFTNGGLNGRAGIIYRHLPGDQVTALRELAAKPLLVRIQNVAKEQFTSGIDDFYIWAHN